MDPSASGISSQMCPRQLNATKLNYLVIYSLRSKAKWLSENALQIAAKRREAKSKGEKERHTHLNAEFQRIAQRDKK